ncbi:uncharacterized protein LOC120634959 isoform X1 [Pararge aegeria]|uniref:uncharacterized protein LOC120634959 isoform X1 n=1 Tax=Pararge aegeria TaxID=116150 RepID=UPI0019CF645C|nr:uncharacterized protein LOC120634959 isoform X1 [Pararge aegeria]
MRTFVLFIIVTGSHVYGQNDGTLGKILARRKRDATGALDILTNHAQPIHADVKYDHSTVDKPCPKTYVGNFPSNIEPGTVFQVAPPKDAIYKGKSLRKSLPRTTGLDIVRAVSRVVTLIALVFTAVVEFYPLIRRLYYTVYDFMYPNKMN